MSLLAVRDLRVSFATGRGTVWPIDGVSLDVAAGSTLGIVGESGSGKSMLMRSVMRLLPGTARVDPGSQVSYGGQDVLALSPRQLRRLWGTQIAIVFQDPMTALNPVRTIESQLTEILRVRFGARRAEARDRAVALLDLVGIPDAPRRVRQYPHELSGGMRQRITIARALAGNPQLLIADEPTTALDVTVQAQILDLLAAIQADRRMAMILVTHDLGVVADQADRIAVMYAGRIVEWVDAAHLETQARHPYTRALLDSVPRIEDPPATRLRAIGGQPPTLSGWRAGCAFAPRCPNVQERCLHDTPELAAGPAGASTAVACHFPTPGEP